MARVNTKLDDWEIADAVEEIKRLKFEKSISWDYIFKHYPNNGSSSGSALMKAVSKHSVIVNYEGIIEFLKSAKYQIREPKADKQTREERAEAIAKRKEELGITYDEMFKFYKGHNKKTKSVFIDQVRRGYGGYLVDLIKWLNELTPEDLATLRMPSEEEIQEQKRRFEENGQYINEIKEMKEKIGLTWRFIFENTNNGCKNAYALRRAMETASGTDFKTVLNDLKNADIKTRKKDKKKRKAKVSSNKNRYGKVFEGRRLVRVYAKENGVFGLQAEYLE